ncbi:MAG: hypothetical protein ACI4A5_09365, partial [Hominilimicola sp.]
SETTTVDTSSLKKGGNITYYLVTTAKDGKLVNQSTARVSDSVEVYSKGAEDIEIVPVYEYKTTTAAGASGGAKLDGSFTDGLYNITVTNAGTNHIDLYVNGYMAANNIDQSGEGRSVSAGSTYTAPDVKIEGGKITLSTTDVASDLSYVKVVKSPTIVERKKKIFITGDSLVANYYGGNEENYLGTTQTGWGQTLVNFIDTDKYEIINLSNAGKWAKQLNETAVPGIIYNAQEGDIFLFESGVNDKWNPNGDNEDANKTDMKTAVEDAVDKAKAAGLNVVLVNPNAHGDTCSEQVHFGQVMLDVAKEKEVKSVDLSKISCDFLTNVYNADLTAIKSSFGLNKDGIHSSYLGAMKYASMVAGELYKLGYTDAVNTDYEYTKTDADGNKIVCKAIIENSSLSGASVTGIPSSIDKTDTASNYPLTLKVFDTKGELISNADVKWTVTGADTENVTVSNENGISLNISSGAAAGSYRVSAEITYNGETITRSADFVLASKNDMLLDSGFEIGEIAAADWHFKVASGWCGVDNVSVSTEKYHNGSKSLYMNGGGLGQRITLTAGTEYELTVSAYSDVSGVTDSAAGFYDGTQEWPMTSAGAVKLEDIEFTSSETGQWKTYTIQFTPTETKEYMVGSFVATGAQIYYDDFILAEAGEDVTPTA